MKQGGWRTQRLLGQERNVPMRASGRQIISYPVAFQDEPTVHEVADVHREATARATAELAELDEHEYGRGSPIGSFEIESDMLLDCFDVDGIPPSLGRESMPNGPPGFFRLSTMTSILPGTLMGWGTPQKSTISTVP